MSQCDKFIFIKRWLLFGESFCDTQDPRFLISPLYIPCHGGFTPYWLLCCTVDILSAPLLLYLSDPSTSWRNAACAAAAVAELPAKTQRRGTVYTWVRFSSLFFQRIFYRTPTSHISLILLPRPGHHGSLSGEIRHPLQTNNPLGLIPSFIDS